MKRAFFVLLASLCVALTTAAQPYGAEVLESVSKKITSMESYGIDFELRMSAATNPSKGLCLIAGDRYIISVDGMTQGFDGETVWVVNPIVEEVSFDNPNPSSRSLFDNPTLAFDFTAELFDIEEVSEAEGEVVVRLNPKEGVLDGIEEVSLSVDVASGMPTSLTYDFGGATIQIVVTSIAPKSLTDSDFEIEAPEGYELIDFR